MPCSIAVCGPEWEPALAGVTRKRTGRYVLTLAGDRICAMTRFENSVLPWFGLPPSLPSRWPAGPGPQYRPTAGNRLLSVVVP